MAAFGGLTYFNLKKKNLIFFFLRRERENSRYMRAVYISYSAQLRATLKATAGWATRQITHQSASEI